MRNNNCRNLASNPTIHGECSELFDGDVDCAHNLPFRCHSLVRVENSEDRLCLARAICIGLKYRECGQDRMHPQFRSYIAKQAEHGKEAELLLRHSGVSTEKEFYGIEDAKKIQWFFDIRYGQQEVRIVIFSSESQNKIIWKGWNGTPAKFNLCLYHARDHFSFLASPKALLKVLLVRLFINKLLNFRCMIFV